MESPVEISGFFNRAFGGEAGASVTVLLPKDGEEAGFAALYADPERTVPSCNPVVADSHGVWRAVWTDQREAQLKVTDADGRVIYYNTHCWF